MPNDRTYKLYEDEKLKGYPHYTDKQVPLAADTPISVAPVAAPDNNLPPLPGSKAVNLASTPTSEAVAPSATTVGGNKSKYGYSYYKGSRIEPGEKPELTNTYKDLYESYVNEPLSPEKEEKRKRAATAIGGVKALGNVANAFSNLIFTGKGAPSQVLPKQEDPDLQTYSDRLRAQREAFLNGRVRMSEADRARYNDEYNRWLAAQQWNQQQQYLENQSENAGLTWDTGREDKAEQLAHQREREKVEDDRWQKQYALQKKLANARAASIGRVAGSRSTNNNSVTGKDFITVYTPLGYKRVYTAKAFGQGYVDAAFQKAKSLYPSMFKQYRQQKLDMVNKLIDDSNKENSENKLHIKEPSFTRQDKIAFIEETANMVREGKNKLPKGKLSKQQQDLRGLDLTQYYN